VNRIECSTNIEISVKWTLINLNPFQNDVHSDLLSIVRTNGGQPALVASCQKLEMKEQLSKDI
jgi:hypothetical protein